MTLIEVTHAASSRAGIKTQAAWCRGWRAWSLRHAASQTWGPCSSAVGHLPWDLGPWAILACLSCHRKLHVSGYAQASLLLDVWDFFLLASFSSPGG